MDREDDAVAEAVVAPALVVVDDEPGVGEGLRLVVGEDLLQPLPFVGGVAEFEARGHLSGQAAALEVVDGLARGFELVAVEARGDGHGLVQAFAGVVVGGRRAAPVVGHLQANLVGEFLDGVDKAEAAVLHQEADRAAVHAATEAVVELLGRADRERGGFFAVEGAAGEVIGAALLERKIAFDDVDDVDAGQQFLDEGLWDHRARIRMRPGRRPAHGGRRGGQDRSLKSITPGEGRVTFGRRAGSPARRGARAISRASAAASGCAGACDCA